MVVVAVSRFQADAVPGGLGTTAFHLRNQSASQGKLLKLLKDNEII